MRTGPLGPTLKRLRGARSLAHVAEAAGPRLTEHQLARIEHGRAFPSLALVRTICDALELSIPDRGEVQVAYQETLGLWRNHRWVAERMPRVS